MKAGKRGKQGKGKARASRARVSEARASMVRARTPGKDKGVGGDDKFSFLL